MLLVVVLHSDSNLRQRRLLGMAGQQLRDLLGQEFVDVFLQEGLDERGQLLVAKVSTAGEVHLVFDANRSEDHRPNRLQRLLAHLELAAVDLQNPDPLLFGFGLAQRRRDRRPGLRNVELLRVAEEHALRRKPR